MELTFACRMSTEDWSVKFGNISV